MFKKPFTRVGELSMKIYRFIKSGEKFGRIFPKIRTLEYSGWI